MSEEDLLLLGLTGPDMRMLEFTRTVRASRCWPDSATVEFTPDGSPDLIACPECGALSQHACGHPERLRLYRALEREYVALKIAVNAERDRQEQVRKDEERRRFREQADKRAAAASDLLARYR
jgi:hypothetical protein